MIHGAPGEGAVWEPLTAVAPSGFECRALDLPLPAVGSAPADALEEQLRFVVDAVRREGAPVRLVGHSFGAWVAAQVAMRCEGSVDRVVVLGGYAVLPEDTRANLRAYAELLEQRVLPEEEILRICSELWLEPGRPAAEDVARIAALFRRHDHAGLARALLAAIESTTRPVRTSARAIAIHATGDRAVPIALGRELAAALDAECVEIASGHHYLQWSHTALVADAVFG